MCSFHRPPRETIAPNSCCLGWAHPQCQAAPLRSLLHGGRSTVKARRALPLVAISFVLWGWSTPSRPSPHRDATTSKTPLVQLSTRSPLSSPAAAVPEPTPGFGSIVDHGSRSQPLVSLTF